MYHLLDFDLDTFCISLLKTIFLKDFDEFSNFYLITLCIIFGDKLDNVDYLICLHTEAETDQVLSEHVDRYMSNPEPIPSGKKDPSRKYLFILLNHFKALIFPRLIILLKLLDRLILTLSNPKDTEHVFKSFEFVLSIHLSY
jgi:hypothetical protein